MRVYRRGQAERFEESAVALRVKCRCGKSLKISSALADRRLACPHCKHPFRIPAAKFKAAQAKAAVRDKTASNEMEAVRSAAGTPSGRASRAASQVSPAPSTRAAAASSTAGHAAARADPLPASLDDELLGDLPGEFEHSQSDLLSELEQEAAVALTSAAPAAIPIEVVPAPAPSLAYARDPRRVGPTGGKLLDSGGGPTRGFWANAFLSFVYPLQSGSNVLTLFIILFAVGVKSFLSNFAGSFGFAGVCIIFGWLASLYFSVIQETASGSEDLPGLRLEEGFLDGIIKPAFKYIGAFAVVLAPGLILGILILFGVLPESWGPMIPIWLAAGVFLLPICLLLFAFDALAAFFRIDLVFSTIFKTFLPYLAIWFMLLIVGLGLLVTSVSAFVLELFAWDFLLSASLATVGLGMGAVIFVDVVGAYLMIVAMRIIGLYYLHFKHRFTLVME